MAQTTPTDISSVGDGEMDFDRAYIGSFCNGSKAFLGQVDDVRVYYGALSSGEIVGICSANAAPAIDSFTGDLEYLSAGGGDVTLTWSASGQCELVLDPGQVVIPPGETSLVVSPLETTLYTLTARNGSGVRTDSHQVVVGEAPLISDFSADRISVRPGGRVEFSWDVAGADSVSINHGVNTADPVATIASTTRFTLTATNPSGSSTAPFTVEVSPVVEASYFIDFTDTSTASGRPNLAATDGTFWNNFGNFRDGRIALVDTSNDGGQGIGLAVVDGFDQLSVNGADGATAFIESAVSDGFLSDVFQSDGRAALLLDGLDSTGATAYGLTFFSSINEIAGAELVVRYTVTGRSTTVVTLDSNGNLDQLATVPRFLPGADGTILIELQPDSPTGLGVGLNVMQVDARLAPPPFVVTSVAVDPESDRVTVEWGAIPGRDYAVERSTDLLNWFEQEDSLVPIGQIGSWEDPDPIPDAARVFYRIVDRGN